MFVCPECGAAKPVPGFCTEHGEQLVDARVDSLLGQAIGSYRVARVIGRGGMGTVYLAVHPGIASRVAIKMLSGECASNPALVERFFAEARAVNVIRHENIVSVIDLAQLPDGRPYIVMEYLDGSPLSAVIRERGALPLGSLARVVGEVLEALGAAHDKGVVHRDLKPDNVFITAGGRAKVLDFGIAKLRPEIGAMSDATRTGSLLGTPQYMSPEQAAGQHVDARADLYAAGLLLFEGATGRRPFDAQTLYELLRMQIEQPPPLPRSLRSDMPPAFESVILRALEKDPARRFQSAAEFGAALVDAARYAPPDSWAPLGASSARIVPLPTPGGPLSPTQPSPGAPPRPLLSPAVVPPTMPGYANTYAPALHTPTPIFRYVALGAGVLLVLGGMATAIVLKLIDSEGKGAASASEQPAAATTPDKQSAVTAPATLAGTYSIESSSNPGGQGHYAGTVAVTSVAEHYVLEWSISNTPPYKGVALEEGDVLGVGWGMGAGYGVAVYAIDGGRLTGRWATASTGTRLGTEVLVGPAGLDGTYRIDSSYSPDTGNAYEGSVSIKRSGATYHVRWHVGTQSYAGVGLREGNVLVVGWGGANGAGVVLYTKSGARLVGHWAAPGSDLLGTETLRRL